MTGSKNIVLSYTTIVLLLLSAIAPSTAGSGIVDFLFPVVKVTIKNKANHTVFSMFDTKGHDKGLEALNPGERISWEFRNIMFPLKWAYVYINDNIFGVFWAYSVRLACTACNWAIKDDGVYFLSSDGNWIHQSLYTEAEYF